MLFVVGKYTAKKQKKHKREQWFVVLYNSVNVKVVSQCYLDRSFHLMKINKYVMAVFGKVP